MDRLVRYACPAWPHAARAAHVMPHAARAAHVMPPAARAAHVMPLLHKPCCPEPGIPVPTHCTAHGPSRSAHNPVIAAAVACNAAWLGFVPCVLVHGVRAVPWLSESYVHMGMSTDTCTLIAMCDVDQGAQTWACTPRHSRVHEAHSCALACATGCLTGASTTSWTLLLHTLRAWCTSEWARPRTSALAAWLHAASDHCLLAFVPYAGAVRGLFVVARRCGMRAEAWPPHATDSLACRVSFTWRGAKWLLHASHSATCRIVQHVGAA